MQIDDQAMLAALRGTVGVEELCRKLGLSPNDFAAARDAFLSRRAALADRSIRASTNGVVEIRRDGGGVPHIHAGGTSDLFFGLGFAMAEDRLWQMDRLRRRALGRQAEILGPDFVSSDRAHLTVGAGSACRVACPCRASHIFRRSDHRRAYGSRRLPARAASGRRG